MDKQQKKSTKKNNDNILLQASEENILVKFFRAKGLKKTEQKQKYQEW